MQTNRDRLVFYPVSSSESVKDHNQCSGALSKANPWISLQLMVMQKWQNMATTRATHIWVMEARKLMLKSLKRASSGAIWTISCDVPFSKSLQSCQKKERAFMYTSIYIQRGVQQRNPQSLRKLASLLCSLKAAKQK